MELTNHPRCECHDCTQSRRQERLGSITDSVYATRIDGPTDCGDHAYKGDGTCKCGWWIRYPEVHK